jgi:RNA polymerase sigma factor (sigma-70 family)
MDRMRTLGLLDSNGKPLAARIVRALAGLLPRLRREYPALQDDLALTEVAEEAGRRLANREAKGRKIESFHGYAWVTLRSVAVSYTRRPAVQLIQKTLDSEASDDMLASVAAEHGSAEQIERGVLVKEMMAKLSELSPREQRIIIRKLGDRSTKEIAQLENLTEVAVDTIFCRAKQKIARMMGREPRSADVSSSSAADPKRRESPQARHEQTETPDGTTRPAGQRRCTVP